MGPCEMNSKMVVVVVGPSLIWSAANGGLRDGGLSRSEDIRGKRPFSSDFWISQVLFAPSGKGRKRQEKGEKGRFRLIFRKGGQTPLKPPFVTPPFAAAQLMLGNPRPSSDLVLRCFEVLGASDPARPLASHKPSQRTPPY